jgi:lipoyl-dependent peroxiredoxin
MKTLFTAQAVSKAGRSGTLKSPEGLLDITLGNPLEKGVESRGLNPELMFAGAYAACYNGALVNAAETLGTIVKDTTARAMVSLMEDDEGGYNLSVEIHAELPGIERELAQRIMEKAHETCPYSKLMRGDAAVTLVLD